MVDKRAAVSGFIKSRKFNVTKFDAEFNSSAIAARFSGLNKFIKGQNINRKSVTVIAWVDD